MNTFLKVLAGLAALLAVVVIAGFFFPRHISVSRTAVIHNTPEVVYDLIDDYKQWPRWSPWHQLDPNMQLTYGGATQGVGAWYSWVGDPKKVGSGKMTTMEARPLEYLKHELRFEDYDPSYSDFTLKPTEGGTQVTWTMEMDCYFNPIMRLAMAAMDAKGNIEKDYDRGLARLDSVARTISTTPALPPTPEVAVVEGAAPMDSAARPHEDRQ